MIAIFRNELGCFDEDQNNSSQITARLSADATRVRTALGDRMSLILRNVTLLTASYAISFSLHWHILPNVILLIVSCAISFSLQWRMSLVMTTAFPLIIVSAFGDSHPSSLILQSCKTI